jgi:hypothetical protein
MATRAELRASLRRRLEDAGASPLWDDATLNDALGGAVARYGVRLPKEAVATVNVTAGATAVPVATAGIEGERIARVLDEAGAIVPRMGEAVGPSGNNGGAAGLEQAWRWWNGELSLQRPATATGTWRIEYRGPRGVPADDVSAVGMAAGDEEIVLALAAAIALRRREVEDGKRGAYSRGAYSRGAPPVLALAERAEGEAERLIGRRKRRAAGGWLT